MGVVMAESGNGQDTGPDTCRKRKRLSAVVHKLVEQKKSDSDPSIDGEEPDQEVTSTLGSPQKHLSRKLSVDADISLNTQQKLAIKEDIIVGSNGHKMPPATDAHTEPDTTVLDRFRCHQSSPLRFSNDGKQSPGSDESVAFLVPSSKRQRSPILQRMMALEGDDYASDGRPSSRGISGVVTPPTSEEKSEDSSQMVEDDDPFLSGNVTPVTPQSAKFNYDLLQTPLPYHLMSPPRFNFPFFNAVHPELSKVHIRHSNLLSGGHFPVFPICNCEHCTRLAHERSMLVSPNSPSSPGHFLASKLCSTDIFKRRSHSDSDLQSKSLKEKKPLSAEDNLREPLKGTIVRQGRPIPMPLFIPHKHGSLESDQSTPQDSPLDLTVKSPKPIKKEGYFDRNFMVSVHHKEEPKSYKHREKQRSELTPYVNPNLGRIKYSSDSKDIFPMTTITTSTTTKTSLRYNLEVSPVVETMPPGSDVAYVCPICGQMFSLHDRLAKHMASRHKSRQSGNDSSSKTYMCEVCKRSFARSDMLTRHMRLHTGVKPYTCRVCGQVFSRSDHLSTHQRTHTGEKPYKCPQCPYAACRRDMITRHMRTHVRYDVQAAADTTTSLVATSSNDDVTESPRDSSPISSMHKRPDHSPSHQLSSLTVRSPQSTPSPLTTAD